MITNNPEVWGGGGGGGKVALFGKKIEIDFWKILGSVC